MREVGNEMSRPGMTLQSVIEAAIAAAFAAGAEWHAIVQCRQDSAEVGRQQRQWVQDLRYQQIVRHHQRQAAESIGRAILRLTIERDGRRQMAMFAEPETAMGRTDS